MSHLTITFSGVQHVDINGIEYPLAFDYEAQASVERLPFESLLDIWLASCTNNLKRLDRNPYLSAVFQRLVRAEVIKLDAGAGILVLQDANNREQSTAAAYSVAR